MSISNLSGDGTIQGDGTSGDGAVAGDGALTTFGLGYPSSALVTTRDGIAGYWTPPGSTPGDAAADDRERMGRLEARVRAQVLDFELLSSFRLEVPAGGNPPLARLFVRDGTAERPLVELSRPSASYLRDSQLPHVFNYADLRRDRTAEIISQIKGIETFFGSLCPMHPERHKFTLELLAAFFRAIVSAEMRIKQALAVPRPVEFSPQIMPMIQTPGHGSFPAGHSAESFMVASVLSALMQDEGRTRYAEWDAYLARLAARISVNRVIAGVHFPIDLAAGLVLGLSLGQYFVALARGEAAALRRRTFSGEEYGNREFPWSEPAFPWSDILKLGTALPPFVGTADGPVTFTPNNAAHSPLCWMWQRATAEWRA